MPSHPQSVSSQKHPAKSARFWISTTSTVGRAFCAADHKNGPFLCHRGAQPQLAHSVRPNGRPTENCGSEMSCVDFASRCGYESRGALKPQTAGFPGGRLLRCHSRLSGLCAIRLAIAVPQRKEGRSREWKVPCGPCRLPATATRTVAGGKAPLSMGNSKPVTPCQRTQLVPSSKRIA
jgi:hypothetical protein